MYTPETAPTKPSVQWMLNMGVCAADVAWLDRMSGSVELHLAGNRERVERIWKTAIGGMLKSTSPATLLAQALA